MTEDDDASKFAKIFTYPNKSPLQRYAELYGLQQGPGETDEQFQQRVIVHKADVQFDTAVYGRSTRFVPDKDKLQ